MEWEKLFSSPTLTLEILRQKVSIVLWHEWSKLGAYQLANETDTALGIVEGTRPNVDLNPVEGRGILNLNPFRTTREQLDTFLERLKTSSNFPIGERWVSGRDRGCVIALCHGSAAVGTALGEESMIRVPIIMFSNFKVVVTDNPSTQIDIIFGGNFSNLLLEVASAICHEFAHVLGLKNESGGLDSMPISGQGVITDASNVQAHSELLDSSGGLTGIGGSKIKWNWPRIMKAGVLQEYLSVTPSELQIKLDNDISRPNYMRDYFNTSNKVRFRQRHLPRIKTSLQEFKITSIKSDPTGDILTLEPTPANFQVFKLDFPEGSLLIVTRPEILEFPDDLPYQRIIHKAVLNHINVSKRPLTAPPPPSSGSITHDCLAELRRKSERPSAVKIQHPKNIPSLRNPKNNNHCTIVGVYEGGEDYECNVYHPTGYCNMRGGELNRFCHVCRYFIVDKLDPTLHRDIDRIYESNYPNR